MSLLQLPSWPNVLAALQGGAASNQAAAYTNYYTGQGQTGAVPFVPLQTLFLEKEMFDGIQNLPSETRQEIYAKDNFEHLENNARAFLEQPDSTSQKRIRHRRTFKELSREIYCPIENCKRKYASRSSLSTHLRLKHSKEAQRQQMELEAKKRRDINRVPKPLMPKAPMYAAGFFRSESNVGLPANISSLAPRTTSKVSNSSLPLRLEDTTSSKVTTVPLSPARRRISLEDLLLQPGKKMPTAEGESSEGCAESEHQSWTASTGPVTPLSMSGAALKCSKRKDEKVSQFQPEGASSNFFSNFVSKGHLVSGMDMLVSTYGEIQEELNSAWPLWPLSKDTYMGSAIGAGGGNSIPNTVEFKDERMALVN